MLDPINYLDNKLTFDKTNSMNEFVDFINNPNTVFFTKTKEDYNFLKQIFDSNDRIIPVQVIISDSGMGYNMISISILNGLLLKFFEVKMEFDNNTLQIDINESKSKLLLRCGNIHIQKPIFVMNTKKENTIWDKNELIFIDVLLQFYLRYYITKDFYISNEDYCPIMIDLSRYTDNITKFMSQILTLITKSLNPKNHSYLNFYKVIDNSLAGINFFYNLYTYIGFIHI
jgi:hypothetical protein